MRPTLPALALALLMALALQASDVRAQEPVALKWELASLPPAGGPPPGTVAVLWLVPAQGFKTYANDPGEAGMPTRVEARLLPGGTPLPVLYPPGKPGRDLYEQDKAVNLYDGPTPLFIPVPPDAPPGYAVEARVVLLACTDVSCWPVSMETSLSSREFPQPLQASGQPWWGTYAALAESRTGAPKAGTGQALTGKEAGKGGLEGATSGPSRDPRWRFTPRPASPGMEVDGLFKALALAVLAGMLLNLMPCVLPVASLKLSGLLAACREQSHAERFAVIREHNLYFAAGMILYFCLLAAVLGLAGLAWGQLFQSPGLIVGAAALLFAMGLSLFGVFHLPVIDLKIGPRQGGDPRSQALFTGFLATLLATPCSGPFLGGVLAWTLLQPVYVVVAVFAGIGVGMATPYLALAARPSLVRFIPRPGAWMGHLEKAAAFLIMATCLYFLSILPQGMLLPALVALLVTALACHVLGTWGGPSRGKVTRLTAGLAGLAAVVAACAWAVSPPAPEPAVWKPFDKAAFNELLGRETLLVDFTADWCPTCKALEKTVLSPKAVKELAARHGLTAIKVDMTRENPDALALLGALGSSSIPLAAVFPKGEGARSPVVLRDLFTSGQLEKTLKEVSGEK